MTIGERIKECRERLNMSQDELAIKMGYTNRSTITRIEKGNNDVTQSKVIEFAKILQTTPEYLMGLSKDNDRQLEDVYFSLAKQAQEEGIDPEDIRVMIETIVKLKKKNK